MIGPVLQFEDLQQLCQPDKKPRLATVEKWARAQGVRFRYDGRGGIWTTLDALNAALGIKAANDSEKYDANQVM